MSTNGNATATPKGARKIAESLEEIQGKQEAQAQAAKERAERLAYAKRQDEALKAASKYAANEATARSIMHLFM